MRLWIDRLFLIALTVIIGLLTVTALPVLAGGHLEGTMLLLHMFASGALVFALPAFALVYLWRNLSRVSSGVMQRWGFWLLILSGLVTIGTVFMAMLPVPSTPQMHDLLDVHGYAGFAMVPAVVLLLLGATRWRRIQSERSATPG
ncbi:MAG: hypothetical protein AB8B91_09035 [Rubripirellula sp.]